MQNVLALAMFRNIQKLSGTALLADVFILLGIIYIFGSEIKILATEGLADVQLFNKNNFPLLIG
jgi:proton-coupled amino acid transporter